MSSDALSIALTPDRTPEQSFESSNGGARPRPPVLPMPPRVLCDALTLTLTPDCTPEQSFESPPASPSAGRAIAGGESEGFGETASRAGDRETLRTWREMSEALSDEDLRSQALQSEKVDGHAVPMSAARTIDYLGRRMPRHYDRTRLHAAAHYAHKGSTPFTSAIERPCLSGLTLGYLKWPAQVPSLGQDTPCIGLYEATCDRIGRLSTVALQNAPNAFSNTLH